MSTQEIPAISCVIQDMAPDGTIMKKKELTVKGKDLKEVEKIFSEKWEKVK